jgi:hypothetical protein
MRLYKSLQRKIKNIAHLYDYFKWLYKKRNQPRSIGTIFSKREGQFIVTYEVIGHGFSNDEMTEEVSREEIRDK